jgi:hypothetical protein
MYSTARKYSSEAGTGDGLAGARPGAFGYAPVNLWGMFGGALGGAIPPGGDAGSGPIIFGGDGGTD